jgi:hypothetical protein
MPTFLIDSDNQAHVDQILSTIELLAITEKLQPTKPLAVENP